MKKINIREALLDIDRRTNAQYDLTTLYEACKLSEDDKKKVVQYIDTKEPPFMIGEFLASKCDAVCEAIVGDDEVSEAEMKKIVDDINDGSDHTLWALMDKADEEDNKLTEAAEEPREGYDSRAAIRQVWGMIANSEKLTDDDSRYWDLDRGVHEGDEAVIIHNVKEAPDTAMYQFSLMDDGIDLDVMLDRMSDNDTWYIIDNTPEALEEDLIEVDMPELENKIRAAATDVVVNNLGYDEDFARQYLIVETSNTDAEDARVKVEVRADLSYEEAEKIADALNPIVRELDKDAYFDFVTHNTLAAYIRLDQSDDVVDEEAFNYWKNIFDKVTTRGDLINYYNELVRKRDEGSITWGTMDKLFDEVIGPLNDRLDAENAPKVEESLDEATVGTMERPMTQLQGTLSSILSSDWNAWAKIRHVEDAVAFLNEIAPQCKNKGYIEKVKSKLLANPRTNIQQFFTNIIMAGDGQGVVKTGKSARIARDRKDLGEGFGGSSLYLFPELTAEDLEMAKAYGLTYLGKNHGPDGSENNCVIAGDMSSLQRYADKYLGYELHPDYLYDDVDDFAGEIIKEEVELTNCPNCGGERFNDNTGLCVDCGYDEKGHGELDESKSINEDTDSWLLVKNNDWYDPEGLNIKPPQKIICQGTKEECKAKFDAIVKDAKDTVEREKNRRYGKSTIINKISDNYIKIYYPAAIVNVVYQLIPDIRNGDLDESGYDFNKYRNAEGKLCADKWYASQYPDDKEGAKELSGILMDDALEDRSIIDGCSDTVKERVNKQLDKYTGRFVNESKSMNEGWSGEKYKGYSILLNDDSIDWDEEQVRLIWTIFDKDGNKVGSVTGLANARKFVDELIEKNVDYKKLFNELMDKLPPNETVNGKGIYDGENEIEGYSSFVAEGWIGNSRGKTPWKVYVTLQLEDKLWTIYAAPEETFYTEHDTEFANGKGIDELVRTWDDYVSRDRDKLIDAFDDSLSESKSLKEYYDFIDRKSVEDSDGFMTDYTMYKDVANDRYVFVFGDSDIYSPEDGDFDWECETEEEARQWFNSYNGFADEEDGDTSWLLDEGIFGDIKNVAKAAGNAIKNSNYYKKNVQPKIDTIKKSDSYADLKALGGAVKKSVGDSSVVQKAKGVWNHDKSMYEVEQAIKGATSKTALLRKVKPMYNKLKKDGVFTDKDDARVKSLIDKKLKSFGVTNEAVEDDAPYTKEQIERDLKSLTKNFTIPQGDGKCGFREEAQYSKEILEKHYKSVKVYHVGDWFEIMFKDKIDSESVNEAFSRNIDLDQIVIQVANKLDDKALGDEWIEVFPVVDAYPIGNGEYGVKLEITGSDEVTRKANFRTVNGRVEVAFWNGSEAKCDSVESIARFIAGEYGLTLPGESPLAHEIERLDREDPIEEALNDYRFEVSCNDGPSQVIRTVASDEDSALRYVKKYYAQENTTYADDRANKWQIRNLDSGKTFMNEDTDTSDMIVMMGSDGVHYYYNSAENTFTSDIEDGTRYAEREIMEDDFREVVKNNPEAYMRKIPNMPHWNK